jgi:hypothetical protein
MNKELFKISPLLKSLPTLTLLVLVLFSFATARSSKEKAELDVNDEGSLELRLDFSIGFALTNEPPVIKKSIDKLTLYTGQENVVANLLDVFDDVEDRNKLTYSLVVNDPSLVKFSIDENTKKLVASPSSKNTGETKLLITASDKKGSITDTVSVEVVKTFELQDKTSNIVVNIGDSGIATLNLEPLLALGESFDSYRFSLEIDNPEIVKRVANSSAKIISLSVNNDSLSKTTVFLKVTAPDNQSVIDTFTVKVAPPIDRGPGDFYPEFTLFTSYYYSGGGVGLWIKDFINVGVNGYANWDLDGIGASFQLIVEAPIRFKLRPYIKGEAALHRETVDSTPSADRHKYFPTLIGAGGVEFLLGKKISHGISIEGGYCYGKKHYVTEIIDDSGETITGAGRFVMPELHLRFNYSFSIR